MLSQLPDKGVRIFEGLDRLHIIFNANLLRDDVLKRGRAIRRLPDYRAHFVQVEQRRIASGHDHHFPIQKTRGNFVASGHVERAHAINSQMRASGVNTKRLTGTRVTKSQTVSKTIPTSSSSRAKKRTCRSSSRAACPSLSGSIRFSAPCLRRNRV